MSTIIITLVEIPITVTVTIETVINIGLIAIITTKETTEITVETIAYAQLKSREMTYTLDFLMPKQNTECNA